MKSPNMRLMGHSNSNYFILWTYNDIGINQESLYEILKFSKMLTVHVTLVNVFRDLMI